jgi:glutamyl-tRNA synthetase
MVERFRLEAVSKNPATFDLAKLEWMNGVYIRELAPEDFVERAMPFVVDALGRELTEAERTTLAEIAPHIQERAKLLAEVGPQVTFLFTDVTYDEASWEKVMTKPESGLAVTAARESLAALPEWSTEGIEQTLRSMLATHELSARKGLQPLRVAVSGSSVSPPLFESMAALGREPTLTRLSDAAARIEAGA